MDAIEETRKQIRRVKTVLLYLALLPPVLAVASLLAGFNLSPLYYWGAAAAVPSAAAAVWAYLGLRRLKLLLQLRERWKREINKDRDFVSISLLHRCLHDGSPDGVDEQTWRDLDLDRIYALLDRTFTAEGQAVLYEILKNPCLEPEPLHKRAALIRAFQEEVSFREKLQLILLSLEGRSDSDTTPLLWGELPSPSPFAPLYTVLALAALLSLAGPFFLGVQGVGLILAMFGLNAYVHHRVGRRIAYMLPAVSGLAALLRAALKIARLQKPEMREQAAAIEKAAAACRTILKKTLFLQPRLAFSDLDLLYEYCKYFFLLEVRAFYAALGELKKQAGRLRGLYLAVGELDALQAVASYRESLPAYVEPQLSAAAGSCAVRDARHPLLENAVPNSITLDGEGVLITGSNMSGKSTFLRTMGLTALFAQTIYTCPASFYRGGFFRIITSISRADSLAEGKSYYYLEAERLLKMLRAASAVEDTPALCIIDELLSGTNYTERLAASEAILDHLARQNAVVIVATHDLDLAEKLQGLYRCCHFTDQVGRDGLYFDYKLKEGIATTRNAIRLLDHLGYPGDLVRRADLAAGQSGAKGGKK